MDKKITIGLFIDTFFPMVDGVIMVVDNYAKRLSNYANVIVFAPKCSKIKFDDSKFNYKVVRCKSLKLPIVDYSLPIPLFDKKFKKELKNTKLDIVHIHSPFSLGKMGIKYAKKHNIPVLGTMHSQYKQDFLRAVRSNIFASFLTKIIIKQFNKCDQCLAVNSKIASLYYEEYGLKKFPKVMNNATDMMPVESINKAKELVNTKYNINQDEKVFLFVGRINNLKNVFFIADSLKILKDKCKFEFKMLFVGTGQDEDKLKSIINKNNMEKDIIMCGKVTDRELLSSLYARADLFLFPSLYDASSIVQIEAASQKTPTLFIKGAATAATIEDNVSGYVCENDKTKFANKIIDIISNEELYNNVCENVYKNVYVNWDDKIKEVFELYMKFINKNEG